MVAAVHSPSAEEQEEYRRAYIKAVDQEARVPPRRVNGKEVVWSPQHGSQEAFLECKLFEALYHGTRGPGKTDCLLMSFANQVGKGHGAAWRGIIFRQTYPQLADVQAKSEKWFRLSFGDRARFNKSKMMWEWDTGEVLMFRHMARPSDYWNYHGHEYPFIGWEELTNWATDECFKSMFACCRCSVPGVPRMVRATTNPYGIGHNWVKERYRLHGEVRFVIFVLDAKDEAGRDEPPRCAIQGHINENKRLLEADPNYKQTIAASAANPEMAKAWLNGSWDIVAGGMFDDVWRPRHHILPMFDVPRSWRLTRSFDWGSSAPFSVGWWAESDGSDLIMRDGTVRSTVRGDLYRVHEWYGWNGRANEGLRMLAVDITQGIIERELAWGLRSPGECLVRPGPADTNIFDVENGRSIAVDMGKPVRVNGQVYHGVQWARADKRPGSRKTGWEMMRKMLRDACPPESGPREHPGLFVTEECKHFIRTIPGMPRDEKDMDDVDTDAEDHVADETRYRVRFSSQRVGGGRTVGMF